MEKLDVIIFGASGFTGKYTVLHAVKVLADLKWGIAGRNREKLECVLRDMGAKANKNISKTPIILADINDTDSLIEMARRCRVVVNCCGPYRFYGEPVVRACIESGTHHIDISGEPQYMETMQLKYHSEAEKRNVYVISACGFDSIPADMGVVFIEKNFDGVVNSVETYLQSTSKDSGSSGIHYGTWESAVYGLAHSNELRGLRQKLYKEKMPRFHPILKHRPLIFRSEIVNGICVPFPGADRSVVMRSQRFLYEEEKKRPIQMHAYVAFGSYLTAYLVALFAIVFGLLTKCSFGRRLLLKYPRLFSLGFVSHEGPTEMAMEKTHFSMTMKALGWSKVDQLTNPTHEFSEPPTKSLMVRVSGPNPGYGATCVALLSSAKILLKEIDKLPGKGGVFPPGAAFAKTNLINELEKHEQGMKFEILANK